MSRLGVDVLGALRVRHGSATVSFPTRKALALFVYLTVEGGLHARDKLAALFWPESDRTHARSMLRYTLAGLRQALHDSAHDPHLLIEREVLGVNRDSGIDLDVDALQRAPNACAGALAELRHIAERCRGEFLEGFSLPDAPDFDEWASLERESWRSRLEQVLDRLSELEIQGGESAEALATVQRWLGVSPVNEEAHRRLMRLHLAAGDRSAALRAYEACRAVLELELHVLPEPETDALAERIRAGSDAGAEAHPGSPSAGLFEGPLVGRTAEFARLVELYEAASHGHTQVVVLQGEPGIGKTRLARDFVASSTARGADVLHGRAFETGGRLPYQPLVDAVRPRLERENAPEDVLADVWLVELGRLLPELRERYPDLPAAAVDEAAARMRLFEAIARLGQALGHQAPVVLFVDDLQWADVGSLDALHYVGRRWTDERTPLLLLLSLRTEALATTPTLSEWLANLPRAVALTRLELGPLTAEDTLHFVHDLAIGTEASAIDTLAQWLYAETGGQPLFVVETLRALLERELLLPRVRADRRWGIELPARWADAPALSSMLPPGVRDVIHGRLSRLAPATRELLSAGSVLGQGFTFEQVCRVAGLSEHEALGAVDEVLRVNVVREAGIGDGRTIAGGYLFAHDKIRDVVYAESGEARRRVFHHRALDALQSTAQAALLAHHALAAGLDEPAVRFSRAAGDEAVHLLAARDAIVHYEHALAIAERLGWGTQVAELHARCGKALASLGRWVDARRELEAGLDGLGSGQAERRAEIVVDLLEVCWWWLDVPAVRRWAAELSGLAEELSRPDLQTAAVSWLAPTVSADGEVAGSVIQYEREVARGRELGLAPPPPVQAYMPIAYYWLGRLEEAVERCGESVQAAQAAHHTSATMFALPNLGMTLAASGRYDEAARVFDEARRFGRDHGIGTLMARAIAMSAGYHLDVFDLGANEAVAEEARALARSLSFAPPAISAGLDLMTNFARRQDVARAERLIDEVAEAAARATAWHGWLWKIRLGQARAEIALARRDWDGALQWSDGAIDESRLRRRVKYEVLGLQTRAAVLHAQGRTRKAIGELRRAVASAKSMGDPAIFLRAAMALLALDGDDALADAAASTATRISQALPDPATRRSFEAALPSGLITRVSAAREPEPLRRALGQ